MRDYVTNFFYSKPYAAAETVPVANTLHQDAFLRDLIQCHFLSIFMNFNHFHEFKYFSLNWFEFQKFEFFNKLHKNFMAVLRIFENSL